MVDRSATQRAAISTRTPPADPGDTVTLPRVEFERLTSWAACWEQWWSPAAITHRAEEAERRFRRRIRAASWDLSAAVDWTDPGRVPIGYQALQRRRYPWLYDPDWRSPWEIQHGRPHPGGPVDWHTGHPRDPRKDQAA
jgi:hypothetical protein